MLQKCLVRNQAECQPRSSLTTSVPLDLSICEVEINVLILYGAQGDVGQPPYTQRFWEAEELRHYRAMWDTLIK